MKKLPNDFDARIFVGHAVEEICVNANQLKFSFGNKVLLVVENAICLTQGTGNSSTRLRINVPEFDPAVLTLIERVVVSAQALPDCTLQLQFESGERLEVLTDSPMYESYCIYHDGREIVV